MISASAGSMPERHASNRSAQRPVVHFASARPTGSTLPCGLTCGGGPPAAGCTPHPASSESAMSGRRMAESLLFGGRPCHLDVQLVAALSHLEGDPGGL